MKIFTNCISFLFLTLAICCTTTLSATSYTYTNSSGDNLWSNPNNWSPVGVPSIGDDATVNNAIIDVDLNINVKTLNINGNTDLTFIHSDTAYIGTFNFSKGWLISTNKIIITDALNWTGNSEITCSAGVDLAATAVSTISGTNNRNLYAELLNEGIINHTGGTIRFQTGGSLVNSGTFNTDGSAMMVNTGGTGFSNKGVYNKTGSTPLALFTSFDLSSGSQLDVKGGSLQLLGGGSFPSGTTINITSGAELDLGLGTFTFASGSDVTGTGTLKFSGGTSSIESNFSMTGTTEITGGTASFNGSNPYNFTALAISGGSVKGTAPLNISNMLYWVNTSTLNIDSTLTIENTGMAFIFAAGTKSLRSSIINEGTIFHTGGNMRYYPGGSITNKGTMTVNGPTTIYDDGGDGFTNEGTFDHQGTGTLNFIPAFENTSDGFIKGRGTLAFTNLINNGAFIADVSYGTLGISGDYDNGNNFIVEFDGSSHGDIVVSGDINLSDDLNIDFTGSIPDGVYTILSTSGGSVNGTFDTENIPTNLSVVYNSNNVQLVAASLPVELSYFRLHDQTDGVLLRWQTASEINSDYFNVEHSTNGRDFVKIGSVDAAGFSNQFQDYTFLHTSPMNGENYYRLHQVDIDGTFEYSDIRVISFYNFDNEVSIFPNPTHGSLTLKTTLEGNHTLQLVDMTGRVVYQQFNISSGATMLDLSGLAKGMYTLRLFDEVFSHEDKLMILE